MSKAPAFRMMVKKEHFDVLADSLTFIRKKRGAVRVPRAVIEQDMSDALEALRVSGFTVVQDGLIRAAARALRELHYTVIDNDSKND